MKTTLKTILAGSAMAFALVAAPQAAMAKKEKPAAGPVVVQGIGVVNADYVVANSAAYKYSDAQRQTHFKAYYDNAAQRRQQIAEQLKPMYDKLEKDSQNPKADKAALRQLAGDIRQLETAGQQELQRMLAPVAVSDQYVVEQIGEKLPEATNRVKARRGVTLVLDGNAVFDGAAYSMDQEIIAELNVLIPTPQLDPPQGWMPRAQREAAAAQAAQQGAAPAAAPAPAGAPVADDGRGN